jgi:hypothetical protein
MMLFMSMGWDYVSELRPLTGPLFILQDTHVSMENHGGMKMSIQKTPDSSTRALWQSYQQSHLVANRRNWRQEWEFGFVKYFCSYLQVIFTCHKILQHGASGFTSPPKKMCCGFLLKIHNLSQVWSHEPWVQWQAHYQLHQQGDEYKSWHSSLSL